MHKRFDDIFSALMLAAAVAVVLAGGWCLSHSIARTRAEVGPMRVAQEHIEIPASVRQNKIPQEGETDPCR